jgi:hypothetical protein
MSISMTQINAILDSRLKAGEVSGISSEIKNWKDLKKEYPQIYKIQVDKIFDELHPY